MRPQFERRARRAAAALGALALGVGISGTVATAAGSRAHPRIGHRKHRPRSLQLRALLLHPNVLVGHDVALIGVLRPGIGNRSIAVQERRGTRWVAVAHATTNPHGYFLERFWPRRLGRYTLRLHAAGLTAAHTTLVGRVATVYHQVVASWYGGVGMTACGQALGAGTLGVANKTLPCGTMVTLHYGARTVRVPVIDRGPYVPGRDYDLTYATKQALGAGDVSQIWASA
jgi:rare lipoprotein A